MLGCAVAGLLPPIAHLVVSSRIISASGWMMLCLVAAVAGACGVALATRHTDQTSIRRASSSRSSDTLDDEDRADVAPIHTLVTLSKSVHVKDGGGRFAPPGEIVLSSGRSGSSASSIPILSETQSDAAPVRSQIDRVLFERLDEYKSLRPREGCLLVVTETVPSSMPPNGASPSLNGAMAALNLARMIAAARDIPTLLIDCGSAAWSRYPEARSGAEVPDVLAFPRVPGLYEIISERTDLDDWMILEDDLPSLMAMPPGRIPQDWRDQLRSDGARRLFALARTLANLTIVYAPRCCDHPELVRVLGSWADGVLLVSGVDPASEASEAKAVSLLRSADITIFGRIALLGGDDHTAAAVADPGNRTSPLAAR